MELALDEGDLEPALDPHDGHLESSWLQTQITQKLVEEDVNLLSELA